MIFSSQVDGAAVGFVICTVCRTILPSKSTLMETHKCKVPAKVDLPHDETFVDEYLVRRMNKVSGPANPLYIQEEVRACFEACRWADLVLVCTLDNFSVRAHSLILAAASSLLASLFSSLPTTDRDEMTLVLADTTQEELVPFLSHLYGQTLENTNFSSHLFQLIDCHQRQKVQQEDEVIEAKEASSKQEESVKILPPHSADDLYDTAFDDASVVIADQEEGAQHNEEPSQTGSVNGKDLKF